MAIIPVELPLLVICFLLFLALVVVVAAMIARARTKGQRDWQDRD